MLSYIRSSFEKNTRSSSSIFCTRLRDERGRALRRFSPPNSESLTFIRNPRVEGECSRYLTDTRVRVYRTHTVASEIPMLHLVVSAWLTRTQRVVSVIKRGRSLAPVLAASVSLFLRVYLRRGSVVSLQREASLSPFLFRAPSAVSAVSVCVVLPLRRAELSSLLRSLQKLRLPPTIAVRRVSNEFGGARIVRRRVLVALEPSGKEKRRVPSLFFIRGSLALPTPAHPVRLPTMIPSRAYTIGIFLVAPPILPLLSSSSRLVQER